MTRYHFIFSIVFLHSSFSNTIINAEDVKGRAGETGCFNCDDGRHQNSAIAVQLEKNIGPENADLKAQQPEEDHAESKTTGRAAEQDDAVEKVQQREEDAKPNTQGEKDGAAGPVGNPNATVERGKQPASPAPVVRLEDSVTHCPGKGAPPALKMWCMAMTLAKDKKSNSYGCAPFGKDKSLKDTDHSWFKVQSKLHYVKVIGKNGKKKDLMIHGKPVGKVIGLNYKLGDALANRKLTAAGAPPASGGFLELKKTQIRRISSRRRNSSTQSRRQRNNRANTSKEENSPPDSSRRGLLRGLFRFDNIVKDDESSKPVKDNFTEFLPSLASSFVSFSDSDTKTSSSWIYGSSRTEYFRKPYEELCMKKHGKKFLLNKDTTSEDTKKNRIKDNDSVDDLSDEELGECAKINPDYDYDTQWHVSGLVHGCSTIEITDTNKKQMTRKPYITGKITDAGYNTIVNKDLEIYNELFQNGVDLVEQRIKKYIPKKSNETGDTSSNESTINDFESFATGAINNIKSDAKSIGSDAKSIGSDLGEFLGIIHGKQQSKHHRPTTSKVEDQTENEYSANIEKAWIEAAKKKSKKGDAKERTLTGKLIDAIVLTEAERLSVVNKLKQQGSPINMYTKEMICTQPDASTSASNDGKSSERKSDDGKSSERKSDDGKSDVGETSFLSISKSHKPKNQMTLPDGDDDMSDNSKNHLKLNTPYEMGGQSEVRRVGLGESSTTATTSSNSILSSKDIELLGDHQNAALKLFLDDDNGSLMPETQLDLQELITGAINEAQKAYYFSHISWQFLNVPKDWDENPDIKFHDKFQGKKRRVINTFLEENNTFLEESFEENQVAGSYYSYLDRCYNVATSATTTSSSLDDSTGSTSKADDYYAPERVRYIFYPFPLVYYAGECTNPNIFSGKWSPMMVPGMTSGYIINDSITASSSLIQMMEEDDKRFKFHGLFTNKKRRAEERTGPYVSMIFDMADGNLSKLGYYGHPNFIRYLFSNLLTISSMMIRLGFTTNNRIDNTKILYKLVDPSFHNTEQGEDFLLPKEDNDSSQDDVDDDDSFIQRIPKLEPTNEPTIIQKRISKATLANISPPGNPIKAETLYWRKKDLANFKRERKEFARSSLNSTARADKIKQMEKASYSGFTKGKEEESRVGIDSSLQEGRDHSFLQEGKLKEAVWPFTSAQINDRETSSTTNPHVTTIAEANAQDRARLEKMTKNLEKQEDQQEQQERSGLDMTRPKVPSTSTPIHVEDAGISSGLGKKEYQEKLDELNETERNFEQYPPTNYFVPHLTMADFESLEQMNISPMYLDDVIGWNQLPSTTLLALTNLWTYVDPFEYKAVTSIKDIASTSFFDHIFTKLGVATNIPKGTDIHYKLLDKFGRKDVYGDNYLQMQCIIYLQLRAAFGGVLETYADMLREINESVVGSLEEEYEFDSTQGKSKKNDQGSNGTSKENDQDSNDTSKENDEDSNDTSKENDQDSNDTSKENDENSRKEIVDKWQKAGRQLMEHYQETGEIYTPRTTHESLLETDQSLLLLQTDPGEDPQQQIGKLKSDDQTEDDLTSNLPFQYTNKRSKNFLGVKTRNDKTYDITSSIDENNKNTDDNTDTTFISAADRTWKDIMEDALGSLKNLVGFIYKTPEDELDKKNGGGNDRSDDGISSQDLKRLNDLLWSKDDEGKRMLGEDDIHKGIKEWVNGYATHERILISDLRSSTNALLKLSKLQSREEAKGNHDVIKWEANLHLSEENINVVNHLSCEPPIDTTMSTLGTKMTKDLKRFSTSLVKEGKKVGKKKVGKKTSSFLQDPDTTNNFLQETERIEENRGEEENEYTAEDNNIEAKEDGFILLATQHAEYLNKNSIRNINHHWLCGSKKDIKRINIMRKALLGNDLDTILLELRKMIFEYSFGANEAGDLRKWARANNGRQDDVSIEEQRQEIIDQNNQIQDQRGTIENMKENEKSQEIEQKTYENNMKAMQEDKQR